MAFLSEYTLSRDNNFNLLRFAAAGAVLVSHSFVLATGNESAQPLFDYLGMTPATMAVDIFFIISGFLIAGSLCGRSSLLSFLWARFLRIYPAAIISAIFSVFVVGLAFTRYPAVEYMTNQAVYSFFFKACTLVWGVDFVLPGVFEDLPFAQVVNGSLWTLPLELFMYLLLAFFYLFSAFVQKVFKIKTFSILVAGVSVLSLFYYIGNHDTMISLREDVRFTALFFTGSAFFLFRKKIALSGRLALMLFLCLLASLYWTSAFFAVYHLTLPYLVLYSALAPGGTIRKFNLLGDYSYGIYIYAFPVQQSLSHLMGKMTVSSMIVFSFPVTLLLACLSWHFVELKCLKFKNLKVMNPHAKP